MTVAVLQLPSIGMSTTKLYHYIRIAHKHGVKLLLLGEYLLNSFFKELVTTPLSMLRELSGHQLGILKELAKTYDMTIIAPMVIVRSGLPYKVIARISPRSVGYYHQQLLIEYPHWNEAKYFANAAAALHPPLVFKIGDIRFGLMGGFELHFDAMWRAVWERQIDCMLLPTASTFESQERWRELIKMRAFTHNCYILRANRIGEYAEEKHRWRFYGDSLLANPDGEIENALGEREELMIVQIDHRRVIESRRSWKFKEAAEKRHAE